MKTAPKLNGHRPGMPAAAAAVLPPQIMQLSRQARFNPLRSLTPARLSAALDAYEAGNLREAALLWQAIASRDDTIAAVKPKRELSTAERTWTVLKTDDSPEAAAQAEALTWFWNHVSAENAYDRNQRGGFARLVEQMMEARSYGFAAHHIVWQPGERLTARFEYVPLQFFENRTGRLRFIPDGISYDGVEMVEGEWMVTTSQPIMVAASIGYMFKRLSLNDWVAFSEKFGMPGVLGRTSASADSAAGIAMASAVESFGNEWVGVIYGDDGTGKIEIIKAEGGSASLPMPALIDRIDRKLATLYRGSDLSSMSSGNNATGASVQTEETDIFDRADARMIGETLNQVDRMVLAYTFGDAEPLAYVQLKVPDGKDLAFELSAIEKLAGMGMEIGVESTREIFGIAAPKDGEELLGKAESGNRKPESPEDEPLENDADFEAKHPREESGEFTEVGKTHPAAAELAKKYADYYPDESAGAGEVTRIPIQDVNFTGQKLDDVEPLSGNREVPIIVRETARGYDIMDGYGRAAGIRNYGGDYVNAILITKGDILETARGRAGGDDEDWNRAIYERYGFNPDKLRPGATNDEPNSQFSAESADLARRRFLGEAKARLGSAYAETLQPVRIALANALDGDDAGLPARLESLRAGLPTLLALATADPAARDTLAAIFAASFFNGFQPERTA